MCANKNVTSCSSACFPSSFSLPLLHSAPASLPRSPSLHLFPSCSTSHSRRQGHTEARYFQRRAESTLTNTHVYTPTHTQPASHALANYNKRLLDKSRSQAEQKQKHPEHKLLLASLLMEFLLVCTLLSRAQGCCLTPPPVEACKTEHVTCILCECVCVRARGDKIVLALRETGKHTGISSVHASAFD